MTVFNEDLYDMVDVHQLQAGDTLVFQGRTIVVATIDDNDGLLTINGGLSGLGCASRNGCAQCERFGHRHRIGEDVGSGLRVIAHPAGQGDEVASGQV